MKKKSLFVNNQNLILIEIIWLFMGYTLATRKLESSDKIFYGKISKFHH
jgi:ammonia channel protein AmtB